MGLINTKITSQFKTVGIYLVLILNGTIIITFLNKLFLIGASLIFKFSLLSYIQSIFVSCKYFTRFKHLHLVLYISQNIALIVSNFVNEKQDIFNITKLQYSIQMNENFKFYGIHILTRARCNFTIPQGTIQSSYLLLHEKIHQPFFAYCATSFNQFSNNKKNWSKN